MCIKIKNIVSSDPKKSGNYYSLFKKFKHLSFDFVK